MIIKNQRTVKEHLNCIDFKSIPLELFWLLPLSAIPLIPLIFIIPYVIIILCLCLYVSIKTYRHHFLSISCHSSKATPRDYRIFSKTEHISGAILWSFTQFVFIVCQVEGYRSILKLTCKSLAFTSYIPL